MPGRHARRRRDPKGAEMEIRRDIRVLRAWIDEGVEWDAVWAGLDAWAAYQEEHGYGAGTWIMFPAYGGGGAEFDFKIVKGYDSHTEMGNDYELYVKRADYFKKGELVDSVIDCDDARLYNGTVRRRQEQ